MKNWTITLDNITKQTVTEFGTLTNEQMNWKPNSITWSIAQNLDHLIVVYVERSGYELYFGKAFENVMNYINGIPTNIANPEVLDENVQ